jgi:hypothetical protein
MSFTRNVSWPLMIFLWGAKALATVIFFCHSVSLTKLCPTLTVHKNRKYAQLLGFPPCVVRLYVQHKLTGAKPAFGKLIKNDTWSFQKAVQDNYRDNPFHNFRHCFSVAQMMYVMIHELKLEKVSML